MHRAINNEQGGENAKWVLIDGLKKIMQINMKDSVIYTIGKFIEGILGLIAVKVYANIFLVDEYGVYSILLVFILLVSALGFGWISRSLLRFTYKYYEEDKKVELDSSIFVMVFIIIIFASIASLVYSMTDLAYQQYSFIVIVAFVAMGVRELLNAIHRAMEKSLHFVINNVVLSVIKIVLTVVLVMRFDFGIEAIFIALTAGSLINIITSVLLLKIRISFKRVDQQIIRKFIRFGLPIIGINAMSWIITASDRMIIGWYEAIEKVGIYAGVYTIVNSIVTSIMQVIVMPATPKLIKHWECNDIDGVNKTLRDYMKLFLYIAIPACVGLVALDDRVVMLFLSESYLEGQAIIGPVALALFFWGFSFFASIGWELSEKTSMILLGDVIIGVLNIGLNIVLVPILGYKIAATTTLISCLVYFVYSIIGTRKIVKFSIPVMTILKVILGSAGMYFVLEISRGFLNEGFISTFLAVAIGGATYVAIVALLNINFVKDKLKT